MEMAFFIAALILGLAIAYGGLQYFRRDKAKDADAERATRALYEQGQREEERRAQMGEDAPR